ncbi:N-acetyltransferase family protein [Halosimplex amylolyticum]|uniref:GNAT family N-acetyltransferase n=1 Tax=Halosimplex amylolyticum TaxID=3396616 RepID=UPI003F5506BA
MSDTDGACSYWSPADCEGSIHCPPRCPRFVDSQGDRWVVRPPTAEDRDALVEMYDDFAPGERAQGLPPRNRPRVRDWLDDCLGEGCNFVVAGDDRVVGHALYTPTDDPEPEFAIFVHQDYQHRGIGTEVSKHVLAAAVVGDRDALTLVVEPSNRPARRLYDNLGFETVEEVSYNQVGRPMGVLRMRRPLDSSADTLSCRQPPLVRGDLSRAGTDHATSD